MTVPTCLKSPPAGDVGHPSEVDGALGRQADGHDVLAVLHRTVEHQYGHIVAICLRCEAKIGMQLDLGHCEHFVRQTLNFRMEDVIAQSYPNA